MLNEKLTVLLVEDDPADAFLIKDALGKTPDMEVDLVTVERLVDALGLLAQGGAFSVVLLDLGLPDSWGIETFRRLHEAAPDVPVVMLTGLDDRELALSVLKEGAQDYIVKGQMSGELLMRAVRYAVQRQKLVLDLERALREVKILKGLLPICANCKKIRNDTGYWEKIETYISQHSDAVFSHGICPDCARLLYPEYFKDESDTRDGAASPDD